METGRDTGMELVAIIKSDPLGSLPRPFGAPRLRRRKVRGYVNGPCKKNRSDSKTANRFRRASQHAKARTGKTMTAKVRSRQLNRVVNPFHIGPRGHDGEATLQDPGPAKAA